MLRYVLAIFLALPNVAHADFRTWTEIRDALVIRQAFDETCGPSALATLINFQYQEKIEEAYVIATYFSSQEVVRDGVDPRVVQAGFSLSDLENIAEDMGYLAYLIHYREGGLSSFIQAGRPALVYIEDSKSKHYVVLFDVNRGVVVLGDPSVGIRRMPTAKFEEIWVGKRALFVDHGTREIGDHKDEFDKYLLFRDRVRDAILD